MIPLYTSAECRALDRLMIAQQGVTGFSLMQRAGQAAFDLLAHRWPEAARITVFCGKGNNAGDGYVVAGLARKSGLRTEVRQIGPDALRGDAAEAVRFARAAGVPIHHKADMPTQGLIVDALLGTGLNGAPRAPWSEVINAINASERPVLSLDLPSGVDAGTGCAPGAAVRADCTISFIGRKLGLHTGRGRSLRGALIHGDLNADASLFTQIPGCPLLRFDAQAFPELPLDGHKHRLGHLVVAGGDRNMGGAPLLAAEAALRCGTGLVSVLAHNRHHAAILARRPELMLADADDPEERNALLARASAITLGPGLGRRAWGATLAEAALAAQKPTLIDADGLRWLAQTADTQVNEETSTPDARQDDVDSQPERVITPHPGEAAALLGARIADVEADRPGAARTLAARFQAVAVLKGPGSLCAGQQLLGVCDHGNPGMASAGMGDVLAGVIGGLLAQGLAPERAATLGVCLHGRAADLAAEKRGQRALVATDLIDAMAELLP